MKKYDDPGQTTPLYKYRALRTRQDRENLRRIFSHQELRFSARKGFNDPFDCRAIFNLRGSTREFVTYCERMLKKREPLLTPEQRDSQIIRSSRWWKANRAEDEAMLVRKLEQYMDEHVGILCLSDRADEVSMWSHYADSHAGICLEFSRSVDHSLFRGAEQVMYRARFPQVRVLKQTDDEIGRAVFLRKAPWWKHEQEWRVLDSTRGPGVRRFSADLLTGVIFGAKMSKVRRKTVLSWIKESRCRPAIFEARLHSQRYMLEIHRLSDS